MSKKRKTRRSNSKYPALNPHLNLKTRFESLDFDYIDSLPEIWVDPVTGKKHNPKQFLNDYANEAIHADFKTNKKRIHKKKRVESDENKYLKQLSEDLNIKFKNLIEMINDSNISTTSKMKIKKVINQFKSKLKKQIKDSLYFIDDFYKKEAEHKNNARNRCILTRAKAQGKALGIDDLNEGIMVEGDLEDQLIAKLDAFKELQNSTDSTEDS